MKIAIALNTAWNLVNFRSGLIRALVDAGYEVVAIAPNDKYSKELERIGCRFVPLPMDNQGTHIGRDLLLMWRFYKVFRRERPAVFLGYTVKPNVYGSLAAHFLRIPVINNIAGLGITFGKRNWLEQLVRLLYRLALSKSRTVLFQNEDDRKLFIDGGVVRPEIASRVPGSGVDLLHFAMSPIRNRGRKFRFLLLSRMLWDKGVGEFVEAASIVKRRFPDTAFCLLGFLDVKNPKAISRRQVDDWIVEGNISYSGVSDDVRVEIADADCIVLPSYYREGVPRSLLEAAAVGRPIITSDTVGCREAVDDGVTGLLCQPHNSIDLAAKMERMLSLTHECRREMGVRGRQKMEREFDENIVIQKYLQEISRILH